jgi:hypothetical protein
MSRLIDRLDRLHRAEHDEGEQGGDAFCDWANVSAMAYPKLRNVVLAAQDFLESDGDYFSWTEDERHCLSRLKEALMALDEEV